MPGLRTGFFCDSPGVVERSNYKGLLRVRLLRPNTTLSNTKEVGRFMTHTSLSEVSVGSIQRLHRIASANDWNQIQFDARDAMMGRQVDGREWRELDSGSER